MPYAAGFLCICTLTHKCTQQTIQFLVEAPEGECRHFSYRHSASCSMLLACIRDEAPTRM